MAMRVSRNLQRAIVAWQKPFSRLPVRWIAEGNLHITLIPPWYTADIDKTIALLQMVAGRTIFTATFTEISFGPDPKRPRLVWATGETPQELPGLKKRLEKTLRRKPERRPFIFHLTLGRFRKIEGSTPTIQTFCSDVSWRETFSSFVLMESHLSKRGATYTTIATFPFQ